MKMLLAAFSGLMGLVPPVVAGWEIIDQTNKHRLLLSAAAEDIDGMTELHVVCDEALNQLLLMTLQTNRPYTAAIDRFSSIRVSVSVGDLAFPSLYAHYADLDGTLVVDIAEHVSPQIRDVITAMATGTGAVMVTHPNGRSEFGDAGMAESVRPVLEACP